MTSEASGSESDVLRQAGCEVRGPETSYLEVSGGSGPGDKSLLFMSSINNRNPRAIRQQQGRDGGGGTAAKKG